jgi:hypothetical protein
VFYRGATALPWISSGKHTVRGSFSSVWSNPFFRLAGDAALVSVRPISPPSAVPREVLFLVSFLVFTCSSVSSVVKVCFVKISVGLKSPLDKRT